MLKNPGGYGPQKKHAERFLKKIWGIQIKIYHKIFNEPKKKLRFTPLMKSMTTLLISFLPWKSTKVERSTFWKSDAYKTNKNKPPNLFYSNL